MAVPYTFGTATAAIPLSQLDTNFATAITLGNTAVYLGNTTSSIGNLTLTNVTISSGEVTAGNVSVSGNVTLSGGTANGVAYLNGSKVLTTGSALVFDGSNLGLGVTPSAWATSFSQKAFQFSDKSALSADTNTATLSQNAYKGSGGWTYLASGVYALRHDVNNATGAFSWFTAASGTAGNAITFTQAMTLDASGNLFVGKTADVLANTGILLDYRGSSTFTRNGAAAMYLNRLTSDGDVLYFLKDTAFTGAIGTASGGMTFSTGSSPTERARIDSSGNLLVGTTSGNSNQYTAGSLNLGGSIVTAGYKYCIISYNTGGSGAAVSFQKAGSEKAAMFFNDSDSRLYVFNANSATGVYMTSGATSWTANSDERLKTDLVPIENAAQKVSTLRAVTGRYKTDEEGIRRSFLIAQDVQAVLPEAVSSGAMPMSDDTTEYLGVSYTDVIPLLVAAIKEQQALIQSLTDRITALESA